jgi:hypothetical protein
VTGAEKAGKVVGWIVAAFLVAVVVLLGIALVRYSWMAAFG